MSSPHAECDMTYSVADLSAVHRDLLWLLTRTGPCEGRQSHRALPDYYSKRSVHDRVWNTLNELTEREFVTTDDPRRHQRTKLGQRALSAQQVWQAGTHATIESELK